VNHLSIVEETKYHVPALEKGLDILEALSKSVVPLTLSDLARDLERGRNELFRMLICLEDRGYIVRNESNDAFTLSLKLFQLAHRHSTVKRLLAHAVPKMVKLAEEIRECCHIAVIDQGALVVLEQVMSPEIFNLAIKIGSRQSIIHTPSGRLLLAYMPVQQRDALLAADAQYQALTTDEKAYLHSQIQQVLEIGYFYSEGENFVGGRSVSALIGSPEIGVTASLAVPSLMIPGANKPLEPMLNAMQVCAAEITHSLGLDLHDQ